MKILYYSVSYESYQKISALLSCVNIDVTWIQQNQGCLTIDEIIRQKQKPADLCTLPDIKVMIFHEMNDEQIGFVIDILKQQGISVPYKCIVTTHNQSWRLIDLFRELMKEHEYFSAYEQLKQCIAQVSELQECVYTEKSWKRYESAFMNGYFLLQKQSSTDELKAAIQAIDDTKARLCKK